MGELEVETPGGAPATAPAKKKKSAKKKSLLPAVQIARQSAIQPGAEILFKVKRLHGYHGTVLDVNADGSVLCRVNEDALEGALVVFATDQLVPIKHPDELKTHNSTRLKYDYPA